MDDWFGPVVHNAEEDDEEDEDDMQEQSVNYKTQYRNLKRKLKFLIYENECFQEALRTSQRSLLKASRDRSFLLDRLLQYEKVDVSSSESDETESSDDPDSYRPDLANKRRKLESPSINNVVSNNSNIAQKPTNPTKKKRPPPKNPKPTTNSTAVVGSAPVNLMSDGHMTPEEVERHLESKSYMEMVSEKAPPTVPTELFSNDPSLDSECNDLCELETSPSNMGEECSSEIQKRQKESIEILESLIFPKLFSQGLSNTD